MDRQPPKYKVDDIVEEIGFGGKPEGDPTSVIVDGPFEPGVKRVTATMGIDDYTYLVRGGLEVHIATESSLATPDRVWENCPGEHRHVGDTWQRNKNTYSKRDCPCRQDDDF